MNRVLMQGSTFCQTCVRRISTSEIKNYKPYITYIKKRQAEFQLNKDVPMYLRGGTSDTIYFYVTCVLTILGVGVSSSAAYNLYKKK